MFSMLGRIFSSSQAQPTKEEPPQESDDEPMSEIHEEVEDDDDKEYLKGHNGEENEDLELGEHVQEEEAHFDSVAVEEVAYSEKPEQVQTPGAPKTKHIAKKKAEPINPRRSRRTASADPEVPNVVTRSRQNSVELSTLPKKAAKAKAQATKFKSRKDIYEVSEDDDTPTTAPRMKTGRIPRSIRALPDIPHVIEEAEEQQSATKPPRKSLSKRKAGPSDTQESEEQELPIKMSKKALKRKASETELKSSSKKQRRKSAAMSHELSTNESARSGSNTPMENATPDLTTQDLVSTAQRLFAEADSDSESVAALPPAPQIPSPVQHRQSTQWTPINSPVLVSKLPSRLSRSEPQVILNAHNPAKTQTASSSQPEEAEASPPKSKKRRKKQAHTTESESTMSTKLVQPRASSSESEAESPPHKSSKRRKRRRSIEESISKKSQTFPSQSPEVDAQPRPSKPSKKRKKQNVTGEFQADVAVSEPQVERSPSVGPEPIQSIQPNLSYVGRRQPKHPEFDNLARAVEMWREEHDMTQYEINDLIQQRYGAENKAFWTHMNEQATHLTSDKILRTCRRLFHNYEARGSWTDEQDTELRRQHSLNPGKWRIIGGAMNRFPEDCRDRWRNYTVCGNNLKKDTWDLEEEEKLLLVVAECITLAQEGRKADGKKYHESEETLINWGIVSQKMGHTRSRLQCATKWKLLKERRDSEVEDDGAEVLLTDAQWRLEAAQEESDKMSPTHKLSLLRLIRGTDAGHEAKIPWRNLQKTLPSFTLRPTMKVCLKTMMSNVADHKTMKFQEVISELIDAYEAAAPGEPEGFHTTFAASQHKSVAKIVEDRQRRKALLDDSEDDNDGGETKKRRTPKLSKSRITESDDESVSHYTELDDSIETDAMDEDILLPLQPQAKTKSTTKIISDAGNNTDSSSHEDSDEAPRPSQKARNTKLSLSQTIASDDEPISNGGVHNGLETSEFNSALSTTSKSLRVSQSKVKAKSKSANGAVTKIQLEEIDVSSPLPSAPAPQSRKNKRKLRESMKPAEEKASQDSIDEHNSALIGENLEDIIGTMKNGMVRTPTRSSQPPPAAVKGSTEKVSPESEDEQEPVQPVFANDMAVELESGSSSDDGDDDIPAQPRVPRTANIREDTASDSGMTSSDEDEDIPARIKSPKGSELLKTIAVDEESASDSDDDEDDIPARKRPSKVSAFVDEMAMETSSENNSEDEDDGSGSDDEDQDSYEQDFIDDMAGSDASDGNSEDEEGQQIEDEQESEASNGAKSSSKKLRQRTGQLAKQVRSTDVLNRIEDAQSDSENSESEDEALPSKFVSPDESSEESEEEEDEALPSRIVSPDESSEESEEEEEKPASTKHVVRTSVDLDARSDDDEHRIVMNGWGDSPIKHALSAKSTKRIDTDSEEEDETDDEDASSEMSTDEESGPEESEAKVAVQKPTPRASGLATNGHVKGGSKNKPLEPSATQIASATKIIPPVPKWRLSQNFTPRADSSGRKDGDLSVVSTASTGGAAKPTVASLNFSTEMDGKPSPSATIKKVACESCRQRKQKCHGFPKCATSSPVVTAKKAAIVTAPNTSVVTATRDPVVTVRKACERCRTRKQKCHGFPICASCAKAQTPCIQQPSAGASSQGSTPHATTHSNVIVNEAIKDSPREVSIVSSTPRSIIRPPPPKYRIPSGATPRAQLQTNGSVVPTSTPVVNTSANGGVTNASRDSSIVSSTPRSIIRPPPPKYRLPSGVTPGATIQANGGSSFPPKTTPRVNSSLSGSSSVGSSTIGVGKAGSSEASTVPPKSTTKIPVPPPKYRSSKSG